MKPDQLGRHAGIEMALHRIPHTGMQFGRGVGLRKNRFAYGTRRVPAFRRLLDDKNDLSHSVAPVAAHYVRKFAITHGLRRNGRALLERHIRVHGPPVRKAYAKAFKKRALPSPQALEKSGEKWRPYRTVACWYLWRVLDIV